jgi:hypothetical protein
LLCHRLQIQVVTSADAIAKHEVVKELMQLTYLRAKVFATAKSGAYLKR